MRVGTLDRLATSGESWLHRSSPPAKWLILAATVAVAVIAQTSWPLAAGYLLLVLAASSCQIPLRLVILPSLLPVPLVGLFALSRWDGNLALAIVGKGMLTSLAGVLMAATTPYPDLLAPVTRILPAALGDSLLLTYRALFILWERVEALWLALRARGGFFGRPSDGSLPWRAVGTTPGRRLNVLAIGTALSIVRGADLSVRLYDVMRMRGYQGRLTPSRPLAFQSADWRAFCLASAMLACGVAARIGG